MISIKMPRVTVLVLLCVSSLLLTAAVQAQAPNQPRAAAEDANLEMQVFLILATNKETAQQNLPAVLDPIVKQLRQALPFKNFTLAASFLNRVKNNGKLEVTWLGGPYEAHGSPATTNPSFSQLTAFVRMFTDDGGRDVVRLNEFRFGTRVPIVVGQTTTSVSTNTAPVPAAVTYEPVGLRTDLSMREGELVIAGTLNVSSSGDSLVVAVSARRVN